MSRAFTGNTDSFNTRAFTDNTSCFNNNNSFNNLSNNFIFTAADEKPEILAWLSPLGPQVRHQDLCDQRVESVGDWLLETKEFRSWYDGGEGDESDHAVLFCYGDPGVGKSYMCSLVVDYLCDRVVEHMAVACFYYDFASRAEQSPVNVLGSLLKQLLGGLEAIPEEIARKFRGQKRVIGGKELKLLDIVNMFPTVSSLQRAFIYVDALDECVPKSRLEVLRALKQILQKSPNTRIFMTGRPHIRGAVDRELGRRAKSVLIKPRDHDMVTYLRARLRKDTIPEVMDSGLEDDIMKSIPEEISESFLLVSLKVEAILRETTIYRRRRRLRAVGGELGLGDAYEATLVRIRAQDGEKTKLAMTALMWICHSERPLQSAELCHALGVEIGSTDFNSENIPATETLLACCQGLVTIDKEATIFRLIHHTLREHLSTSPNLFPQAHSTIAETCLTYLNSDQVKALSSKTQPDLASMPPFLKYCSRYWGTHANRELSDRARSLAMRLLAQWEDRVAAESLFEQILEPGDPPRANGRSLFSGLHCAYFFGIVEIMTALSEINGSHVNQRDSTGMTPLTWAVRSGHVKAVELLLGQETVDPNVPDHEGRTPFFEAAARGHASVVKQLLDREDINPDKVNDEGRTPLHWAANNGHESVVRHLLDRGDVNPDRSDSEGSTPLSQAAAGGRESVVKQLLDRGDVNPDKADDEGRTPLYWAANNGHESVVKHLLDRGDVNPDRSDSRGFTPLSQAAAGGHESVVKQLLDREDVNPDKINDKGRTPLHWAANSGHESVVRHLLDRGDVNPDRSDSEGSTPLSQAAVGGHESVVEQLLDREDVNPDKPDKRGFTPLSQAAAGGHESVVKQLLDRGDVNPDKADDEGRTPLHWAADNGHESVVKHLLDRGDVNPDRSDSKGFTPLFRAAAGGHESAVKQLLDRGDVNPDKADDEGRTPLHWAANGGHESVVKHLLGRGDVDPDRPNHSRNSPVSWAAVSRGKPVPSLGVGKTSDPTFPVMRASPHFLGLRLNSVRPWSSEFWTRNMSNPTS